MEGRVLKVRQVGDPILFAKSEEVDLNMIMEKIIHTGCYWVQLTSSVLVLGKQLYVKEL